MMRAILAVAARPLGRYFQMTMKGERDERS